MNMFKKIILILIMLFSFINIVNASTKYKFICDNNICNNTAIGFISNKYYLYNINYTDIGNFSNFINWKLDEYKDYYWNTKFKINWYCEWDCSILEDKEFDLNWIISLNKEFHIWSTVLWWVLGNNIDITYNSWVDFLFSNFSLVINDLHKWFPIWDKKSSLKNILSNIISYDCINNKFNIKNVCVDKTCNKSELLKIWYNSTSNYYLVSGDIRQSTYFKDDTFKVSNDYNISRLLLKAWWNVNFNFWFEDYLEFIDGNTEYEYRIYYNYKWEGLPDYEDYFLKETILINNGTYTVSSPNISNDMIKELIDVKILDGDEKKIRVWVKEWIILTKAWEINFYLAVKNISSWNEFKLKQINSIPVTVLPNDNIKSWISNITSPFTPELNSADVWFNADAPFNVSINLYDLFKNEHFDTIDWYSVFLSEWSSEFIEISKGTDYAKEIIWIETNNNNSIQFNFRITKPWYHNLNWFDIKVKSKIDSNNYKSPIIEYTIKNIIPWNLYNGDQKMNIFIKEPFTSELPVSCWQTVNVNFTCTSDNFSWCNASWNTTNTYFSKSQNWTYSSVTIIDKAYNKSIYEYIMNHVDRTAPTVSLLKWSSLLNNNEYTYIVNEDDLKLNFFEWTTINCEPEINYIVKVDWLNFTGWLLTWSGAEFIIPNFFKKSWIKNLYVKATDKYWNFSEKNIKFTLNPDFVSESNSKISMSWLRNSNYANNYDEYEYKITLLDKYLNPIYNKKLLSLDTDCSSSIIWGWCKNIKTTLDYNWEDALIESDISLSETNSAWEISFKLKSLAPWIFTELFKIWMYNWDSSYNDLTNKSNYSIWNPSTNSFKYPVVWTLSIVEWWTKPEIWREQKYKITLIKENDNKNNLVFDNDSEWSLKNVSKSTIVHKTPWHIWKTFWWINNKFWNDLNSFLWFSWSIDANTNILKWVSIITNNLSISYKIWWKIVEYYLSNFWITWCDTSTLWLKVIWTLQWDWKSDITWQDKNFSDLSKFSSRTTIRMNWYKLIKWLKSWDIINWVKYIKWEDIEISWDLPYETLIVKDWNVIISWDLNISNKKLWIIVLKDNYLVNSDYWKTWNIYVNKDVNKINAIIYSDWAFRSADSLWKSYSDIDLGKQLELNWTLFTRNTIWWAVRAGWLYLLPWWQGTSNYDLAEIYDLNFTRKIKDACGEPSFIIKYNSSIQSNPPIGFGIK